MPTALITGASRGIGRQLVAHLAAAGCDVVAGVRTAADAEAVGAGPRLQVLFMSNVPVPVRDRIIGRIAGVPRRRRR